nr:MAG TPA: hypothetical protein [Inoviridae sp.]
MKKDDWTYTSPFVFFYFIKNKAIRRLSLTAMRLFILTI